MAFEISLRLPFSLPRLLWVKEDEPQQGYRWIGQKGGQPQNQPEPGKEFSPKGKDTRGYRDLSTITMGEVDEISRSYEPQLVHSPLPGWVARNYFCMVHLKRRGGTRPPAVFGRVKACYPNESHTDNIQELELYFPHKNGAPDVLLLHASDIDLHAPAPVQSYYLRVCFLFSPEESTEFRGQDHRFHANGFFPDFDPDYLSLLNMNDRNFQEYPWFYIIGSRWFASLTESRQQDIREKLDRMVTKWGKHIFNYHPKWLPREIHTLNDELDYHHGFTQNVLIEPRNPEQAADIVTRKFNKVFQKTSE
jgi:hypothetical protein